MIGYEFKPFLHVERWDKSDVDGILNGLCWITAKLDGTNACVWADGDGNMHYGSRKREITTLDDNAGFASWMQMDAPQQNNLVNFCQAHTNYIVYGEFGVGKVGAIKDYKGAMNRLWIFDIFDRDIDRYLTWLEIKNSLEKFNLDCYTVDLLSVVDNPTIEYIIELANKNKFLLEDTDTIGEGVVIRNFDFQNQYGHYAVAKYVREDFRPEKPQRAINPGEVEQAFIDKYLTTTELEKAKAKTALICGAEFDINNIDKKFIGIFINLVWKDFIEENIVDFLKKKKNPIIDFKVLNAACKLECRKFLGL